MLESAGAILKAAGMTHADVVSARVYLPETADFPAMNEAYRGFFPEPRPARATVQAGLAGRDYVVEITLVAVKASARRAIAAPIEGSTPGPASPNLSAAIQVGERLFLSGMLGNSKATKGDAAAQTLVTLERLGRTLRAAGFDWEHVKDGIVYVTDTANRATVERLWRERLGSQKAAGVTIVTGLVAPDGLVGRNSLRDRRSEPRHRREPLARAPRLEKGSRRHYRDRPGRARRPGRDHADRGALGPRARSN